MKLQSIEVTELPSNIPPPLPKDGVGKVIARGDVAGTLGMEVARDIAADRGVTVIVTDLNDEPAVAKEGLQVKVEFPVPRLNN